MSRFIPPLYWVCRRLSPTYIGSTGNQAWLLSSRGQEAGRRPSIAEERTDEAKTRIPGLDPSSPTDGNRQEIGEAGSLHEFLLALHAKFGPIASFWYDRKWVVSIGTPKLFKEHQHVFDRPGELFEIFVPIFGPRSIQFANGPQARHRRRQYDRAFSHDALPRYCQDFQKVADSMEQEWLALGPDDHVPVTRWTNHYALKCALWALMGDRFQQDDLVADFKQAYDTVFEKLEERLSNTDTTDESGLEVRALNEAVASLQTIVKAAVESRRHRNETKQGNRLIDILMEVSPDEETVLSDAVTFTVGGYHTTGNALSWCLYFLATHAHAQEKLCAEINDLLGEDQTVDESNFSRFKYLFQVVDESIRCAVVPTWAARVQDCETRLGGYVIPAKTPVFQALGAVLQDPVIWPDPKKFDPERFRADKMKDKEPFSFPAFGFGGKRPCPGYRFAYWEAAVFLSTLIRRFQLTSCNEEPVKPIYGFLTRPEGEIWITAKRRT